MAAQRSPPAPGLHKLSYLVMKKKQKKKESHEQNY